jgi:hypothetical protein
LKDGHGDEWRFYQIPAAHSKGRLNMNTDLFLMDPDEA